MTSVGTNWPTYWNTTDHNIFICVTFCLPSKDDKSILLSMHIWCKTEKLLDMYQSMVDLDLRQVGPWSPHHWHSAVKWPVEMDLRYGQCHIPNDQLSSCYWALRKSEILEMMMTIWYLISFQVDTSWLLTYLLDQFRSTASGHRTYSAAL